MLARDHSTDHRQHREASASQRDLLQEILGPKPSTTSQLFHLLNLQAYPAYRVSSGGMPVNTSGTLRSNPGSKTSQTSGESLTGSKYVVNSCAYTLTSS